MNIRKLFFSLIAVAASVAVLCLVLFALKVSEVDAIRSGEADAVREVTVLEELEIGKKDVLVAESDRMALYVNPRDMNLIVEDKTTGTKWYAADPDGTELEQSLFIINYVGDDNTFYEWDSYTYCTGNYTADAETPAYRMFLIENGVRIALHINEGASQKFFEYMPHKMSVENYENLFLGTIDRLKEEGDEMAEKYKRALTTNYKKKKEEDKEYYYLIKSPTAPATSASRQLIELSRVAGYTTELLLADAEEFGFTVEFEEPAIFDITVDITLEGDEVVVNIPVKEIVNGNEFFTLQNIEVFHNFGYVKTEQVGEGYLFVPDGAGALLRMNTYDAKVPDYVRGFYNNDYYTDYSYKAEYGQELMMPVFGSYVLSGPVNEDGTTEEIVPHGFMAVVENGADTAFVETRLASDGSENTGRSYNKVYTTYDISQYEWVPVFGEYAENQATFLSFAPMTEEDYTLRYFFFTGEEVSYYNMAKTYRNYLCDGAVPNVYQTEAQVFFETLGTLSLEKRILGIPYDSYFSMTTYEELADILADMGDRHVNVVYKGVFDGGMNHKLMNSGKLVDTNGDKDALDTLIAKVEGAGDSIYLETDFLKVYDKGNGFVKWLHGLEDYSKSVVDIYGYRVELGIFKQRSNMYNLLDPKYVVDVVTDFKNNVEGNYNYYVNEMAEHYYADYGNEYISPYEAQRLLTDAMETLSEGSGLALDNPRMDALAGGSVAVDVSRESSELNAFYTSIPFRQLVLNGMMKYTTTSANNNSDPANYYLMQAIETGAQPKFTVSAKNVDVLKDSKYSYYFSVQYDLMKEEIKEVYDKLAEAMEVIGTTEITNHTMLAKDVFLTEYANGTEVVTNYTFDTFEYNQAEVAADSYLIIKGGE